MPFFPGLSLKALDLTAAHSLGFPWLPMHCCWWTRNSSRLHSHSRWTWAEKPPKQNSPGRSKILTLTTRWTRKKKPSVDPALGGATFVQAIEVRKSINTTGFCTCQVTSLIPLWVFCLSGLWKRRRCNFKDFTHSIYGMSLWMTEFDDVLGSCWPSDSVQQKSLAPKQIRPTLPLLLLRPQENAGKLENEATLCWLHPTAGNWPFLQLQWKEPQPLPPVPVQN